LPPVDLVELDGTYYVRDGHHRISVARSLGQDYIEAEITKMTLSRRWL
jgi:ParB-like chromosome segregation protein Spo0J